MREVICEHDQFFRRFLCIIWELCDLIVVKVSTHGNDGGARFILRVTNLEFGIDSDAATEEGANGCGAFNQGVGADVPAAVGGALAIVPVSTTAGAPPPGAAPFWRWECGFIDAPRPAPLALLLHPPFYISSISPGNQ